MRYISIKKEQSTPSSPQIDAGRVKALVAKNWELVQGLRIGVKTRACSGVAYSVEYADEPKRFEEVVEQKGVRLFINPTAVIFIRGSEVDYKEDRFTAASPSTIPTKRQIQNTLPGTAHMSFGVFFLARGSVSVPLRPVHGKVPAWRHLQRGILRT